MFNRLTAFSATARYEEVRPAADSSFGVFTYDRPSFERGWHYHPEVELTLVLESSGSRLVGDDISAFGPGDLVLLGPNLPHMWRNETVPLPQAARAHSIYVHFQADWLNATARMLPELHGIRSLVERASRGLSFQGPERRTAARRMSKLPGLAGLRKLSTFWELMQELAESGGGEPLASAGFAPALDASTGDRIHRIHQYIHEHFRSGIAFPELVRAAGMSPAALSKFYRRTTGRTVTEFINEVRVGEASRLLIDTAHNVSEIAFASGFESLAHFNSTFRRLKNLNPTGFRARHLGSTLRGSVEPDEKLATRRRPVRLASHALP